MLIDKKLAYIDPRWRTRSYVEGKLVEIMEKCWKYNPDERIDIFEVVRLLRDVLKESKRRKAKEKEQQRSENGHGIEVKQSG
jgi:hypothetical protein